MSGTAPEDGGVELAASLGSTGPVGEKRITTSNTETTREHVQMFGRSSTLAFLLSRQRLIYRKFLGFPRLFSNSGL